MGQCKSKKKDNINHISSEHIKRSVELLKASIALNPPNNRHKKRQYVYDVIPVGSRIIKNTKNYDNYDSLDTKIIDDNHHTILKFVRENFGNCKIHYEKNFISKQKTYIWFICIELIKEASDSYESSNDDSVYTQD